MNLNKTVVASLLATSLLGLAAGAQAAPDWSKVGKREVLVFATGVSPIEWINKKSDHSGTTGLRKGETCVGCHEDEFSVRIPLDEQIAGSGHGSPISVVRRRALPSESLRARVPCA